MLFIKKSKETEKAIEDSYDNADREWLLEAENTLWKLCRSRRFVTSDDILNQLENKGVKTHSNSALGGVFIRAKNNGWIKPFGYMPSTRHTRHSAPVRVWKSLLNKGGKNAIQKEKDRR